jgi:hypothetical protein
MFRSFRELRRVDPGYDPRGVLTFLAGDAQGFPQPQRRIAFLRELHGRAISGVQSVGAANDLLHAGGPPHETPWSTT